MSVALRGVSHVEGVGVLRGPGKFVMRYRFEFAGPNRESVERAGGVLQSVRVNGRRLTSEKIISIGRVVFYTIDSKQWRRSTRSRMPRAQDALNLNGANGDCCGIGTGQAASVGSLGLAAFQGRKVYKLVYRAGAAAGQLVVTTVLVSASSYLPLFYTSTSEPPVATSQISLRYGTQFSIVPPR